MVEDIQSVVDSIEGLRDDLDMVQQVRSNYELENLMIGKHPLPGRQRRQAVMELQASLFTIKRSRIARDKINLKIEQQQKVFEAGDAMTQQEAQLEIGSLNVDLAEMDLKLLGVSREANAILVILATLPLYTREQLEAEEGEYWRLVSV
jgi:hypothetical protein